MNYREKIIDNKNRHEAFRKSYWKNQMLYLNRIGIIFVAIGLIFLTITKVVYDEPFYAYVRYSALLVINVFVIICSDLLRRDKKTNPDILAKRSDVLLLIVSIVMMLWTHLCLLQSFQIGFSGDFLANILALTIMNAFFYLPWLHYVILFIIDISLVIAVCVVESPAASIPLNYRIELILILLVLFRIGEVRYKASRETFEANKKNSELYETVAATNQELLATNEDLVNTTKLLAQANEDLKEAGAFQRAFTTSMNHDMRAPLNGVIGNLQVLQMDEELYTRHADEIDSCMISSKTLLGLVNDILDYSKLEAGEMELLPAEFDLREVMTANRAMFKSPAEAKGIKVHLVVDKNTPCALYGDDFRISQVINNIVSNAIKYTEKGTVTINVSVENEKLIFVVADTGQGMSEESLKDLFIPFKRINEKNNRNIQGTGLGMSIVKHTLDQMNGTIDVKSKLKVGTTFTICMPIKVVNPDIVWGEGISNVPKQHTSVRNPDLNNVRILYVDDTAVNLKIFTKMLANSKAVIDVSSDPLKGFELLMEKEYDLIFLDHMMPEMTGEELMEKLQVSNSSNRDKPVIILTGNAGHGVEERYREQGFAGYMTKPIIRDTLIDICIENLKK